MSKSGCFFLKNEKKETNGIDEIYKKLWIFFKEKQNEGNVITEIDNNY